MPERQPYAGRPPALPLTSAQLAGAARDAVAARARV
jgi:hypothetical protein